MRISNRGRCALAIPFVLTAALFVGCNTDSAPPPAMPTAQGAPPPQAAPTPDMVKSGSSAANDSTLNGAGS